MIKYEVKNDRLNISIDVKDLRDTTLHNPNFNSSDLNISRIDPVEFAKVIVRYLRTEADEEIGNNMIQDVLDRVALIAYECDEEVFFDDTWFYDVNFY